MSDLQSDSVDSLSEPQSTAPKAAGNTANNTLDHEQPMTPTAGDGGGGEARRPARRRRRGGRGRASREPGGEPETLAANEVYAERRSPHLDHEERASDDAVEAGDAVDAGGSEAAEGEEAVAVLGEASERGQRSHREHGHRDGDDDGHERPTAAAVRDDGEPADIDPSKLDLDGVKILNRLHRFGHEAFFVGGCVRDALVGCKPKDFDIATSAHPNEVRSLFRNCRLIGRRFRLAHIYFRGGKIIEVATFRANPTTENEAEGEEHEPGDLLITRDNVFGTAEEDARRRDFSVNGLFYDIRLGRVIDHVNGRRDVEAKLFRTIGDPEVRMHEDPVRLLRAVRFVARLGFDIDPKTYAAMEGAVEDLPRCAPARLLEEIFKVLRSGSSKHAFELLDALGALKLLLPPVAEYLKATGPEGHRELYSRLAALDARVQLGPVDDSIIMAVLLAPVVRGKGSPENADSRLDALLEQMVQDARLPRRIADRSRQLLWAEGILNGERKRRRSLSSFRTHPIFPDALTLAEIGVEASGVGREQVERWRGDQPIVDSREAKESGTGEEGGSRRKRRPRRRRPTGTGEAPPQA